MIQDLSGSWCIKGTDESMTRVDSTAPLMHHELSDLRPLILIQITPKECSLREAALHVCHLEGGGESEE